MNSKHILANHISEAKAFQEYNTKSCERQVSYSVAYPQPQYWAVGLSEIWIDFIFILFNTAYSFLGNGVDFAGTTTSSPGQGKNKQL